MLFVCVFCILFVIEFNEVFVVYDFSVNKVFFEVGVNFICCLWCS